MQICRAQWMLSDKFTLLLFECLFYSVICHENLSMHEISDSSKKSAVNFMCGWYWNVQGTWNFGNVICPWSCTVVSYIQCTGYLKCFKEMYIY